MFGRRLKAADAHIKQEADLQLWDVFVGVLVLKLVVFEGWDHLFDNTQADDRAWNYFWASVPALEGETH